MKDIVVAGVTGDRLNADIADLIAQSGLLVCSAYIRSLLEKQSYDLRHIDWVSITPLPESLGRVETAVKNTQVVLLTSGDPLFFGIGRLLRKKIPTATIHFVPALSAMQVCFSRFGIPWDDAIHVSLHGRSMEALRTQGSFQKMFLFTDSQNSPRNIARYLLKTRGPNGCDNITVHIGERLFTDKELLYSGSVGEVARMECAEPNCMILVNHDICADSSRGKGRFGLKEEAISHSRGLITKNEIRAAVMHALDLPEAGVLWDVGAGSGSISIESARMYPTLSVYSIERNPTELKNIDRNRSDYLCYNLEIIDGEAPDSLHLLPVADRVFIGGSGGKLEEIIRFAHSRLCDTGHFVMTAVTENSISSGPRFLHELGYSVTISEISVRRYTYPQDQNLTLNPIHLIVAKRNS